MNNKQLPLYAGIQKRFYKYNLYFKQKISDFTSLASFFQKHFSALKVKES